MHQPDAISMTDDVRYRCDVAGEPARIATGPRDAAP